MGFQIFGILFTGICLILVQNKFTIIGFSLACIGLLLKYIGIKLEKRNEVKNAEK